MGKREGPQPLSIQWTELSQRLSVPWGAAIAAR
jgi:hypothetical protein